MNVKATVNFKRSNFVIYPIAYDKYEMEIGGKYLGDKGFAHVIMLTEFCHSYRFEILILMHQ